MSFLKIKVNEFKYHSSSTVNIHVAEKCDTAVGNYLYIGLITTINHMTLNPVTTQKAIDSLKIVNAQLHTTVDSLKTGMLTFNTKAENFDKIVYIQITVFTMVVTVIISALLAAAGFVSWKWLGNKLEEREKAIRADIKGYEEANLGLIDGLKADIKIGNDKNAEIEFNVSKAMWLILDTSKLHLSALSWLVDGLQYAYENELDHFEKALLVIDGSIDNISKDLIMGYIYIYDLIITGLTDLQKNFTDDKHKEQVATFVTRLHEIRYSTATNDD